MTYWEAWHHDYDDRASGLSQRLAIVRREIDEWLEATAPRPVRVLSLCAGDGRDLLGVLDERADADRVSATLVELDPGLADRAREAAHAYPNVVVQQADAGDPQTYADLPPADLVLLCGVLGNVSDEDVHHTINSMPALCAEHARLIWTRTRRPPDLTPSVREWFSANGFREVAFQPVATGVGSVGVVDLVDAPTRSLGPERLFTFETVDDNERTRRAYEARADRYREHEPTDNPAYSAFLVRLIARLGAGATVLELGSGTGHDAAYLRYHGLHVQPSDVTEEFLEGLRADGWTPRRIDLLGDSLAEDLGQGWDAVVAFAVLLHVPREHLPRILGDLHQAVRPGGHLALTLKEGEGEAWSARKLGVPRHFTFWREAELRATLESSGWSVESIDHVAGATEPWLYVIASRS